MDDYYLNEAVRRLDDFLADIDPSFRVTIEYGPGEGHCWVPHTPGDLLDEMAVVVGATP